MIHHEYLDKFPLGLSAEAKTALIWKIEQDYQSSELAAVAFKDHYITFAVNFYTRDDRSLEDVIAQYQTHRAAAKRKALADAFMGDIKRNVREREFETLM